MTKIQFKNLPDTTTPINADNLNKLNNVAVGTSTPTQNEEVYIKPVTTIADMTIRQGNYNNTNVTNRLFTKNNTKLTGGKTYVFTTTLNLSTYKYAIALGNEAYPTSSFYKDYGWATSNTFVFTPAADCYWGLTIAKQNGTDDLTPSNVENVYFNLSNDFTTISYLNNGIYVPLTYSREYIDNKISYSTEEIIVGVWNGKPLYRKVIEYKNTSSIGSKNATTNISIAHGISNLKLCTRQDMIHINGHKMPISVGSSTGGVSGWSGITQVDTTNINFRIINDTWNATTWTIILEYTKTTD